MKKVKKQLNSILGDGDLQAIGNLVGGLMDKQAAVLASKKDLEKLATKEDLRDLDKKVDSLEERMNEGFEAVMNGIDTVVEGLAEKERLEKLVLWAREVGEKVEVKVKI
jgi:hypothetical protein